MVGTLIRATLFWLATVNNPNNKNMRKDQEDFQKIVQIPKVELHAHLNGCVRESTLLDLAKERGVRLSEQHFSAVQPRKKATTTVDEQKQQQDKGKDGVDDRPDGASSSNNRSLSECFVVFDEIRKCVTDLDALARITKEALDDFAAHHVAYLELRSTPKQLLRADGTLGTKEEYLDTVLGVLQQYEQDEQERYRCDQGSRLPLVPRFLVSIDRSSTVEEARENVELTLRHMNRSSPVDDYVVGMDLGGNPAKADFRDFLPVLQEAKDQGIKLTLHCGKSSSLFGTWEAEPWYPNAMNGQTYPNPP